MPQPNLGRIAVIFHRVGPYHFARLRAAGRGCDLALIEVFSGDAVYDWDPVLGADGFARQTLFPRQPQPRYELRRRIQVALDEIRPAVVAIPGWSDAVAYSALQWCLRNQVPAVVMSESTSWDEPRIFWKEWVKRRFLKMCAGGLVGGKPHAEYLANLGVRSETIFHGYDAVDNSYFTTKADECREHNAELRVRLGLPEHYFLASARFIEKKNLPLLLQAYARYRELASKSDLRPPTSDLWSLVLLGDGPLRTSLESQVSSLKLQDCVKLPGFKQYPELPSYYALAGAFIHPSTTEQWGLVVNEAMASGLPVLVSNRCGCASDLVQEGVNGFTFDPFNVEQLAQSMLKISAFNSHPSGLTSPPRPGRGNEGEVSNSALSAMGDASQRIIAAWGSERFADGLAKAVAMALSAPLPKPGLFDRLLLRLLLLR